DFKFIIYTQKIDLILPYVDKAGTKIELRKYVPRKQLIQELSRMDFVINFNNETKNQLPSKLIDYYLTKRPILSLDSSGFSVEIVDEFLEGDYSNRYIHENPEQYKIENITKDFLNLVKDAD
nr:hypothetical protein [Flavobacteriaceae bacterium]